MSDKVVSYLRTAVPIFWGSILGWLLTQFPGIPEGLSDWLHSQVEVVVALCIFAWYALWRWLEPRLPDSITKILLGSAKTPVYVNPHDTVVKVDMDEPQPPLSDDDDDWYFGGPERRTNTP